MTQGLFRKQAVEHQKQGLLGDVILIPNFSHTLILGILVIWTIFASVWLFTSNYSRKETVKGWLEPPSGVVRLYPEMSGVIQKVFVQEGDLVSLNEPIMAIQSQTVLTSGQPLTTQLLDEYSLQKKIAEDELQRTISIYSDRDKNLTKNIASSKQEYLMLEAQLATTQQRYNLISAQANRLKKLTQDGYVSSLDLDNVLGQELSLKNDLQNLLRGKIKQQNTIEQLQAELILLPNELANSLANIRAKISNITQQMTQVSGQDVRVIRASRPGIVNNLQASEGQQIYLGTNIPLLTIISDDSALIVQLLVPVRSIGFVAEGQLINIRYDAFPYEKFGIYKGTVEKISKTILLPNELSNTPISTQDPVYRVTARLIRANIQAYGKDFPLRPGMTLSADISLGERSLAHWLFEPIYSLNGRI